MRGFTLNNGLKFKTHDNIYVAIIGDYDAWISIKPIKGGYQYASSVMSGVVDYMTERSVKEIAEEVYVNCRGRARRAYEAFSKLEENK